MLDQLQVATTAPGAEALTGCDGIAAGATIQTLRGLVAVQDLVAGDRVVTRNGARTLRGIDSVVIGDVDVVHIAPGALGHDRPDAEMLLPVGQQVFLRDWRAQALYGAREALVTTERLIDGEFLRVGHEAELTVFRLRFDGPEIVYANGVELPCSPVATAG